MSLNTGWGYFYLAGAIDDGRWQYAPLTVVGSSEPKFGGSVSQFIEENKDVIGSQLSNSVKVCPICSKSCGYSLKYCNNCGASIEQENVTRSDNALMGFAYGIGVSGTRSLGTSIRYESESFLVYDDLMQTTLIHLNAIPTTVYIPDFRHLFAQPKRGLDLIRSLYEKAKVGASDMLTNAQFMNTFYSPAAIAEVLSIRPSAFIDKYVLCGFNYPPSQCQLHLQFIMPPYVPYHAVLQAEGKHADMNRFFPFEYVAKVLETLVFSNRSILLADIIDMNGIELIGYLEKKFGLNYYHFYHKTVADNHDNSEYCSNWKIDDFKYLVVNKKQIINKKEDEKIEPFDLIESDKNTLQSYGRQIDGKSIKLQYYSFAKNPGEIPHWSDETNKLP